MRELGRAASWEDIAKAIAENRGTLIGEFHRLRGGGSGVGGLLISSDAMSRLSNYRVRGKKQADRPAKMRLNGCSSGIPALSLVERCWSFLQGKVEDASMSGPGFLAK